MARPSKHEEDLHDSKLRPFFEMVMSATVAARHTGIGYKTVQKRFKEWRESAEMDHQEEISQRQRNAIAQYVVGYDKILYNLNAQLQTVTGLILQHKEKHGKDEDYELNWDLENKFTELNKLLAEVVAAKTNTLVSPFIDESSEAATIARLQKKLEAKTKEKK